jgi:hypothetical protein
MGSSARANIPFRALNMTASRPNIHRRGGPRRPADRRHLVSSAMYFRLALRAKTQPIGNYRGKTTARMAQA